MKNALLGAVLVVAGFLLASAIRPAGAEGAQISDHHPPFVVTESEDGTEIRVWRITARRVEVHNSRTGQYRVIQLRRP